MKKVVLRPVFSPRVILIGIVLGMLTQVAGEWIFYKYLEPLSRAEEVSLKNPEVYRQSYTGLASWYDYGLADDLHYSAKNLTAASRDFPRGTCLRVSNLENKQYVMVRVNDFVKNHAVILDLSSRAFASLAELDQGLIKVEVRKYPCP